MNEHSTLEFTCDIFCNVIDNFGDIGISWRLAKQLNQEFGYQVRLWVDDMKSFHKLCPQPNCYAIDVRHWSKQFPDVIPAKLVIEAFACQLPENYIAAMCQQSSLWINLEYMSAESWVEGCHLLPSPHPTLKLNKYFFFPGFTEKTGGLILEKNLLSQRTHYDNSSFWAKIKLTPPPADTLVISLFCYENEVLHDLFTIWSRSNQPILCLVPEGKIQPQVELYLSKNHRPQNNLRIQIIPFVTQEQYDELLWACDINFVRGEDSCVRAQWAAKPFIWHIYPQHDGVHLNKLDDFLTRYSLGLNPGATDALLAVSQIWNGAQNTSTLANSWQNFIKYRDEITCHTNTWAEKMAKNNLALNLLNFAQKIGTIRGF